MAKARWSSDQFKKAQLIETPKNGFVKADRLVAKEKVEKIIPTIEGSMGATYNPYSVLNRCALPVSNTDTQTFRLPTGEVIKIKHVFNIAPCPAPRMTRSDQWKTDPYHPKPEQRQRKPVTKYFDWRDTFRILCAKQGYVLDEVLRVIFVMPVPDYLSRKKREMRMGQPHKQRPDTDNMIKSIKDSFNVDDGYVWDERGIKIWGEEGKILIF